MKFSTERFRRVSTTFVTAMMLLFLVGFSVLILTGGYRIEFAGMRLSSNSLLPPLVGFSVFAVLRIALRTSAADFALFAGSVLLSLALAEGLLRWLDPPIAAPALQPVHQPSKVLSYELIPSARGVGTLGERISINAEGNRDSPFDESSSAPTIAVIGDSFTFAMGVEVEEGFVDQLEYLLGSQQRGIQVVNLGVIAYSFWQYLEVLDRRVPRYQPDLVVIAFFMDDVAVAGKPGEVIAQVPFSDVDASRFTGSKLLNAARNTASWFEARYRSQRGADYLASLEKRKQYISAANPDNLFFKIQTGALEPVKYEAFGHGVDRLAGWSREHDVPVLVVFIPDASQLHEPPRQDVNRRVAAEFKRARIPFIDTTPRFEEVSEPSSVYLFPLDAHTNADGHRIIAEEIAAHPLLQALLDP